MQVEPVDRGVTYFENIEMISIMLSSEGGLNVIRKLDLKKLQSECEILRIRRRDNFEQRMSHIDKEINNVIKASNVSQEAQA